MTDFQAEPHTITRIDINTFDEAAPAFDPLPVQRIVESSGNWHDVRAEAATNAPNELTRYGKIDATPLLGVAGHRTHAIEDLVGNHVIAESMFRPDPKALLYAPLRMLVYSDADGRAIFVGEGLD